MRKEKFRVQARAWDSRIVEYFLAFG